MKKIVILFALIVFGFEGFSQGNKLVFNQVLTFAGNNIQTNPYPIGTVPSGKVWKIEYLAGRRSSSVASIVFTIDGTSSNDLFDINWNNNSYNYPENYYPFRTPQSAIWLKATDQITLINAGCCGNQSNYFISVIEFNVIPE